jgi:hypothetical protein
MECNDADAERFSPSAAVRKPGSSRRIALYAFTGQKDFVPHTTLVNIGVDNSAFAL